MPKKPKSNTSAGLNNPLQNNTVQEVAPNNHALTIPGKNGGRLRNGGTNKGGTGRPSNALRIRLGAIAKKFVESADSMKVAGNADHPQWLGLGKFATEMTEGRPVQAIEGGDKPLELIVRVVRE